MELGSWEAIAWKIGRRGSVEAILKDRNGDCDCDGEIWRKGGDSFEALRKRIEEAFLEQNIIGKKERKNGRKGFGDRQTQWLNAEGQGIPLWLCRAGTKCGSARAHSTIFLPLGRQQIYGR